MRSTQAKTQPLKESLEVTEQRIVDLRGHPDNPRIHDPKQVKQIAKSIETFGFKFPVLVDVANQIIAGHGRVLACEYLGIEAVPTICVRDLSSEKVRALMIADNKLTENAKWDEELLAHNFKILSDLDLDFNIDVSGFDYGEVESLVMSIEGELTSEGDESELISEALLTESVVSELGDVWQLGNHLVCCGDALVEESYKKVLGRKKASVIFTDPPYNLSARDIGKVADSVHGDFCQAAGEMSEEEFESFLASLFSKLTQFSKHGSIHYVCMDWRHLSEILSAGKKHYQELKNLCIWAKDRAGMGSFYRSQHELVLVFKHGKRAHQNHFQLGEHGRYRTNVWSYPSVRSFSEEEGEADTSEALQMHPTMKPIQLVQDALLDCSKRGELVLDAFLGSGTTLLAAERCHRHCVGIEIDPRYVDVAIKRWQSMTGKEAIHQQGGETFNQRAKDVSDE